MPPSNTNGLHFNEQAQQGLRVGMRTSGIRTADHDVALLDEFTAPWPSDLFHDRNHLDVDGAAELSRVVGDWLAELCGEDRLPGACDGTS